jgi:hypothetical protein
MGNVVDKSQDVDEESDIVPPLPGRTLRRRGLSDSSIHSSFSSQGDVTPSPHLPIPWPDRNSVFQALSRTVQNIRGTITPLRGPLGVGGVEVGTETPNTSPHRQKSATLTPSVDSAAKSDGHSPSPSQPQTPPTAKRIAQPKPIRITRSHDGGGGRGNVLPHFSGRTNSNNMLFDPTSPSSSDPFVVSSLRDESRMTRTLSGRVRDRTREFF